MDEFEQLYRRYYKDVYLYLCTLTGDCSVAEDLTAETFLRAYSSVEKFRGDCDIRTWLCKIARNQYISHYRKNKRLTPLHEIGDIPDPYADVTQTYEDQDSAERIQKYLNQMKEPYRQVFTLRVFSELPFAQIAKLFGKSEGWARVTFLRAKRQIQEWMEVE
ncbi:MAG: RNA polymerase sigma factor [Lachnospiraceae bacterium]|nr:RNA polymerase sigma factor [Lachnospiraceae bacterium]